jgi:large subunit ribosomal protein L1
MAQKKNTEEVIADEQMRDEVAEVRDEMPEVDLPQAAVEAESEAMVSTDSPAEDAADEEAKQTAEDDAKVAKAGKRSAKAVREAEEEEARQAAKDERAAAEEAGDQEPKAPRRTLPNPLHQHGKKYRAAAEQVDRMKLYGLAEALELAAKTATTKFDSSVELHINLGIDPRQADQMVRASVVLPHGTGKTIRVAVFADGEAAEKAKAAGADLVGTTELLADIEAGKLNFDMLIATPDKMATLGKVAKVLGPRGLMPNPKSGTVTPDAAKAVTEAKAGKVEFRTDKQAIVHQAVGKVSFKAADLRANAETFLSAILKAKPSAAKGTYVKAIAVTTSMGPGIKVDAAATTAELSNKK